MIRTPPGRRYRFLAPLLGALLLATAGPALAAQTTQLRITDVSGGILDEKLVQLLPTLNKAGLRELEGIFAGRLVVRDDFTEEQRIAGLFAVVFWDEDPYAGYEISFENDSDEVLGASFLYRIDTATFRGPEWQATETLAIELIDRNGDGATLTPALSVFAQTPEGPVLAGYRTQYGFRGIRTGVTSFGFSFFDGLATEPVGIAPGIGSALFEFVAGPAGFVDYIDSVSFPLFGDVPWNNLGVELAFQLSPGDKVNIRGLIDVAPVPGPASLPLLLTALGCGALARYRRFLR